MASAKPINFQVSNVLGMANNLFISSESYMYLRTKKTNIDNTIVEDIKYSVKSTTNELTTTNKRNKETIIPIIELQVMT